MVKIWSLKDNRPQRGRKVDAIGHYFSRLPSTRACTCWQRRRSSSSMPAKTSWRSWVEIASIFSISGCGMSDWVSNFVGAHAASNASTSAGTPLATLATWSWKWSATRIACRFWPRVKRQAASRLCTLAIAAPADGAAVL